MSAAACSCAFQPVCGIVSAQLKTAGRLGAVNTAASHCATKGAFVMRQFKHIMLPAWLQYSDHETGSFYGIISVKATPHNATVARADNTNDCLTLATYVGGARL